MQFEKKDKAMNNDKRIRMQMIIVVSCVIFAVLLLIALIISLVNLASVNGYWKRNSSN